MFYFKDDKAVTVYFNNGDIAVWNKDNSVYDRIIQMCIDKEWIRIEALHNQAKVIMTSDDVKVTKEGITVKKNEEEITFEANEDSHLVNLINILKSKGSIDTNIERAKPFLMNCLENPHIKAVEELFEYCKAKDFEITEDGCFLAYKNVRSDYGSKYDNGKTKHAVGEYTTVESYDTNRHNECSKGLHFCSKSYLDSYSGEKTIIVKVNPKDVVSIPRDYNFAKGRCCRYMMVGELAKDGTLRTTNLEVATGEKIVKTKDRIKVDKKLAKKQNKSISNENKPIGRIQETVQNMGIYNNDVNKVAKVMNLSPETVKRNLRKAKAQG